MKIISNTPHRSKPMVNMTDDMVRIVIDMTKQEFREFDKKLKWDEKLQELVWK